jgi:hypothetical protein
MTTPPPPSDATEATAERKEPWLTPGVRGIGTATFLADVGHEIPTALLTSTLGAQTACLLVPLARQP